MTVFPITQNRFYSPILRFLTDGEVHSIGDIRQKLADNFHLSPNDLSIRLSSGSDTVFGNRFGWAKNDLLKYGYIQSPSLGTLKITSSGLTLIKRKQKITKNKITRKKETSIQEEELQKQELNNIDEQVGAELAAAQTELSKENSPDEQIQEIIDNSEKNLPIELLELLRSQDPSFFEKVVINLIETLYDARVESEHPGGSDDKGIDGIVKPDSFGFEAIYIQAKRYKKGNYVGRSDMAKFVGDLTRHGAMRGVFITTSDFMKDALEYFEAIRNNATKIVLINGDELVRLMIENEVGTKQTSHPLKTIDYDFFEKN